MIKITKIKFRSASSVSKVMDNLQYIYIYLSMLVKMRYDLSKTRMLEVSAIEQLKLDPYLRSYSHTTIFLYIEMTMHTTIEMDHVVTFLSI